jgi:hypothetical protein
MPDDHEDRSIYIVEGSISVAGQEFDASQMMVFRPGDRITIAAGAQGARLMILGGATFPGPATSGGVSLRLRRRASKRPNPNGARKTGARGASIFRAMTGMSTFLFRTDRC